MISRLVQGLAVFFLLILGSVLLIKGSDYHKGEDEKTGHEIFQGQYDQKKLRRELGFPKLEAPKWYSQMERERRTPYDLNEPSYGPNYLVDALENVEYRKINSTSRSSSNNLILQEQGPSNVSGRTRGLLIDPRDASGNTWIAGSSSGGIWRTTDGGQSWTHLTSELPNLGTNTIAASPTNFDIIYAGTGEHFTRDIDGAGLFKTTNGGQSWRQMVNPSEIPDFRNVSRIIVDPNDPNNVLAATSSSVWGTNRRGSIYKSSDGGQTWRRVYGPSSRLIDDLDHESNDFSVQYACVRGAGVLKSSDAGESWQLLSTPSAEGFQRIELDVSEVNNNILWLSAEVSEDISRLFFSRNGGAFWNVLNPTYEGRSINILGGQGWYDNILKAHPFEENEVYVGGVELFKFEVSEGLDTITTLSFTENGTSSFWSLFNFTGSINGVLTGPQFQVQEIPNVEIRFGQGSQRAHRFTVGNRASGVPEAEYEYEDYVEVPFQVWDVSNNRQLMVSFRDQAGEGRWNLDALSIEGDPSGQSREYIFIHLLDYSQQPDPSIAQMGGVSHEQILFLWPVSASQQDQNLNSLPRSSFVIGKTDQVSFSSNTSFLGDVYNSYDGNNIYSFRNIRQGRGLHPDQHNIITHVTNRSRREFRLIVANDGGIYRSNVSSDPASTDNTFFYSSPNKNTTQFYSADKSPVSNQYIGGMQDNGTWASETNASSGAANAYDFLLGGDGFEVIWNNRDPNLILGSSQFNGIRRSSNAGRTWSLSNRNMDTGDNAPFLTRLTNSRNNPDRVYALGRSGIWYSENFGSSWSLGNPDGGWRFSSRMDIEVSKADHRTVWAGGFMTDFIGLQLSEDGGQSFRQVNGYSEATLGQVSGIGSHPDDRNTVYALFSFESRPKILRSTDLGDTWTDISGFDGSGSRGFPDVAVNCLFVFPNNADRIWAGTEIGIVESLDAGSSWSLLDTELGNTNIHDFILQGNVLVIATYGRGIWSAEIPDLDEEVVFAPQLLELSANPIGNYQLEYELLSDFDSVVLEINESERIALTGRGIGSYALTLNTLTSSSQNSTGRIIAFSRGRAYYSYDIDFELAESQGSWISYRNDFSIDNLSEDFVLTNTFDQDIIGSPFSEVLQTPHPYQSNRVITARITRPFIVNGQTLSYRDIAIVEPGLAGSVPGESRFFDYVTVEASLDGNRWTPLIEGYDASFDPSWLSLWENGGSPDESHFKNHSVDLEDYFEPDDRIFVRFVLYSDPSVTGWGWVIDDLVIEREGTSSNTEITTPVTEISIFPMPANGMINWDATLPNGLNIQGITLHDVNGRLVDFRNTGSHHAPSWDLSSHPKGIYFANFKLSNGTVQNKKVILN